MGGGPVCYPWCTGPILLNPYIIGQSGINLSKTLLNPNVKPPTDLLDTVGTLVNTDRYRQSWPFRTVWHMSMSKTQGYAPFRTDLR